MSLGIAGRLARGFLDSKLTPLFALAALAAGALALATTPREEEPQISVPMIDVVASLPGATPAEVERLITQPIEQRMWEIPGVEHVYAGAGDGMTLVTVRFKVGEDQDQSTLRVQAKLAADLDRLPPGAMPPLVKPHGIDDVPILALTLHGAGLGSNELRGIAGQLEDEIHTVPEVAQTTVIGGDARQMQVTIDPARLAAAGLGPAQVLRALQGANARAEVGDMASGGVITQLSVGAPLASAADVGDVLVGASGGHAVPLRAVATITDSHADRTNYVMDRRGDAPAAPAVTIAVAKRRGANAADVATAVLARVTAAQGRFIPGNVRVDVTRNYGETSTEKSRELMLHLALATASVTLLVWLFLGFREAMVVLVAVPVTLALTLFAYRALGYSLNRITLFALIFSIGILVDDAIVVVENLSRHLARKVGDPRDAAAEGVDEVGNPTILATVAVIAAILPMAFVRGLMGPYMRPIPVGASVAMLASLGVAFIVTPWVAYRLLRGHLHTTDEAAPLGRLPRFYTNLMHGLMAHPGRRRAVYGGLVALLLLSMALVGIGLVQVKMLPFDNKSEFQVVLDFPEGTALETSAAAAADVASVLRRIPEVVATQVYAGTAAPANFNGLVRHYFLRRAPDMADVQVTLLPKDARSRQSHAIAVAARPLIDSVVARYGGSAKVAEIPPGPPVLSTLVAEVYGPTDSLRLEAARAVKHVFETTTGVVDVDWSVEAPERRITMHVDRARAAAAGTSTEQLVQTVALAAGGMPAGLVADPTSREGLAIVPRLAVADRSSLEAFLGLPVATAAGTQPLGRFLTADTSTRTPSRTRKDLRPVIYVTGDVAGAVESPVYAILAMNRRLDSLRIHGHALARYNASAPDQLDELAYKWDGEWQVTLEVFRDLGIAFAVVLLLIYVLVVGWFRSFSVPLVIMAPIPLTLIGILPGHVLSGSFFTATSMIGMIALAGIIVRNSILLVDFIELAEARGTPVGEAVIEAGLVRFRPIALTAAAVVVGGLVMVLDPIFQGLAVSLMSGAVVATLLTMVIVPLLYWQLRHQPTPSRGE